MFTSTIGENYYEHENEFYRIKDYSDSFSDGRQFIYLDIPFRVRLWMSIRIVISYIKLAMSQFYSYDISENNQTSKEEK